MLRMEVPGRSTGGTCLLIRLMMALLSALVPFMHSRAPVPSQGTHIHDPSSMSGMLECDGCQQIQASTAAFQLMSIRGSFGDTKSSGVHDFPHTFLSSNESIIQR